MITRPTAEIIAELRDPRHLPGGIAEEAADRLAELDAEVARLQTYVGSK